MSMNLNQIGSGIEARREEADIRRAAEVAQAVREHDAIANGPLVQSLLPGMVKAMEATLEEGFAGSEGSSLILSRSALFRRMPADFRKCDEREAYIAEEQALAKLIRDNDDPKSDYRLVVNVEGEMLAFKVVKKHAAEDE